MASGIVDFDSKKDYYGTLGVSHSATAEELKSAHVKLALEHHPDMRKGSSTKFEEISEAWAILSKPEMRIKYNAARGYNSRAEVTPSSQVSEATILSQRANFEANFGQSQSRRQETVVHKYRSEKWLNSSLEQRKASRSLPIKGGGMMSLISAAAAIGVAVVLISR